MSQRVEPRLAALMCVAVLGVSSVPVHAQQGGNAAKEYNRVAIDAFKAGDYETALENFEHAFELNPDPKIRLNLGVTNENLNRFDEARGHYDAFLRENPRSDKAAAVKDKLAAVEKKMREWGKVVVSVEPKPDSVELAGRRYTNFPLKLWLAPGKYPMKTVKSGYDIVTQEVDVKPGVRFEVKVSLKPTSAAPQPAPVASATPAPAPAATTAPAPAQPAKTTTAAATPAPAAATESTAATTAAPATTTEPAPASAATTTETAAAADSGGGSNPAAMALRGLGGVGLGVAVLTLLSAALFASVAGGTLFYWAAPPSIINTAPVGGERAMPLYAAIIYGGAGLAALAMVLLPVVGLAAVGSLAASFFL